MTDILDLKDWTVLSKSQSDGEYVIAAEYTVQPNNCPKCGVVDTPYKHGVKPIKYRDGPIRGFATVILAQVQRYRCKHCKETFLQPLAGIYPDMRMTQRCVDYIRTQCLRDTFVKIAEHIGCDDKTVRSVAKIPARARGPEEIEMEAIEMEVTEMPEPELVQIGQRFQLAMVRAKLLHKHECRCQSCLGVFDPSELYVSRMGTVLESEPMTNRTLMCAPCKERFHTEGAKHGSSTSTP